jgi:hypothetical protein
MDLPNQNFRTMLECLWQVDHERIKTICVHEDDLISDIEYDVVFTTRTVGASKKHLHFYRDKGILLTVWHDDLHRHRLTRDVYVDDLLAKFNQADLIFLPYYRYFLNDPTYESHWQKAFELPWSVPSWIFRLSKPWSNRENKILLSGMVARQYPLRKKIKRYFEKSNDNHLFFLKHPGYRNGNSNHDIIGRKYYKMLSSLTGAVVTTAKKPINYTVAKYMEIPACGALAFMQRTPDLDKLGFVDGLNFVSISKWDYKKKLKIIDSDEAKSIARAGQQLIQTKHTHPIRVNSILSKILTLKAHRH